MALKARNYPITLDIGIDNEKLPFSILQGSTDLILLVTLSRGGDMIDVDSGAKVDLTVIYPCKTGSFIKKSGESGNNITITNNVISVPFVDEMVTASGENELVLNITDGVNAYTYGIKFDVDQNPAYTGQSVPDNLPTFNKVKEEVEQIKQDVSAANTNIQTNEGNIQTNTKSIQTNSQDVSDIKSTLSDHKNQIDKNTNDIQKNTQSVATKADSDLSNVGSFGTASEGDMFYKKGGKLEVAPININDGNRRITTAYSLQTAPGTVYLGPNLSISQNGGFVENYTQTLDKWYLMLDYENDRDTGSKRPMAWPRGAKQTQVVQQSVDGTVMNNISEAVLGNRPDDHQTQAIYFKFVDPVTNFKMKINVNGTDVMDYPYGSWDNDDVAGFNKGTNVQKIDLQPFWSTLKEYNIKLLFKADSPIKMLGNGTVPWYAVDMNPITRKQIAYLDDVQASQDIESVLTEGDDANGKNIENIGKLSTKPLNLNKNWSIITDANGSFVIQNQDGATFLTVDQTGKIVSSSFDSSNIPSSGSNSFKELTDTPSDYSGEKGKMLIVKTSEDGIVFADVPGQKTAEEIATELNGLEQGKRISYNSLDDTPGGGTAPVKFTDLTDTPTDYIGSANKFVRVNSAHTVLEFSDVIVEVDTADQIRDKLSTLVDDNRLDSSAIKNLPNQGVSTFKELTDTPSSITPSQMLVGNSDGSSLEFVTVPADVDTSDLAKKDLSNVDNNVLQLKSVAAGMLQQELEDISLDKLNEKGIAANLAGNKLENVLEIDFELKLRQTQTLRTIYSRLPQFRGLRAKVIEAQQALTTDEFNIPDQIIHIRYQVDTQNQFINQVLPSSTVNKVLIIEVFYSSDVTTGGVKLTPAIGEYFNGSTSSFTINKEGMAGNAFSEVGGWDWIPYSSMPEGGINVNDQRSNFYIGMESMAFGDGFTATQDPEDKTKVKIDYDGEDSELTFVDTETGNPFTAKKLKSLDKSIRLSQLDQDTVDIAILGASDNVGVFARLNEDLTLNSEFSAHSKLHFIEDPETKNSYVYGTNKKGFVMQDVNPQDDPNISGGSQFICIFDLVPSDKSDNIISQDGSIVLQLLDSNGDIIQDAQNKELGVQIDYKAGQKFKEEIFALVFTVKSYTEVFPNILMNFPSEEIIDLSADTSITLQSFTRDFFKGIAIKAFEDYSGHHIDGYIRYYGYNSINLAQYLSYDVPIQDLQPTSFEYSNRLYFSCKTEVKFGIQQGKMVIKDDGTNFPIYSIAKVYDSLDCEYIGGKAEKITVKLENNNTAFDISLFNYIGNEVSPPRPELLRYDGTTPVFTDGWTLVETMPIDANISLGQHLYTKDFLMPENAKQLAVILYPRTDSIPKELYLVDMEGDFVPWFNRFILTGIISEKENARMYQKEHYLTLVNLPKGISGYRFTADSTDTKVPIGVVLGGNGKIINNNAWADTGAYDPNKVQGDYEFLEDGKIVDFSYIIPCYNEGVAESEVHFWLAKVNADGTFTEILNSRVDTVIPANRTKSPLLVSCPGELDDNNKPTGKFTFSVKKGESVRVFMKSDKTDGFYIECGDGMPFLYKSLMDFYEVTETDKNVANLMTHADEITFVDNGVPVPDQSKYSMRIDVKTGQTEIKEV